MNRSPLFYPMNRGMDSDAGGAADLQTDVMRFMAILSLCLVAIFALVQSIPPLVESPEAAEPVPADEPAPPAAPIVAKVVPPVSQPPRDAAAKPSDEAQRRSLRADDAAPSPQANQPVKANPPVATDEEPPARAAPPAALTESPSPAVPEEKIGFTLRFQSDFALTRLVATGDIGLYAIHGNDALRLAIENDRPSFWSASVPRQFHEMDASTVPAPVIDALRRTGDAGGQRRWGVTLPAPMSGKLSQILSAHKGGDLVIGADGQLRLE